MRLGLKPGMKPKQRNQDCDQDSELDPGKILAKHTTKDCHISIHQTQSENLSKPVRLLKSKIWKAFCKIFGRDLCHEFSWVSWCETWLDLAGSLADSLAAFCFWANRLADSRNLIWPAKFYRKFTMLCNATQWLIHSLSNVDLRFVSYEPDCQRIIGAQDLAKWSFPWNHKEITKIKREACISANGPENGPEN